MITAFKVTYSPAILIKYLFNTWYTTEHITMVLDPQSTDNQFVRKCSFNHLAKTQYSRS